MGPPEAAQNVARQVGPVADKTARPFYNSTVFWAGNVDRLPYIAAIGEAWRRSVGLSIGRHRQADSSAPIATRSACFELLPSGFHCAPAKSRSGGVTRAATQDNRGQKSPRKLASDRTAVFFAACHPVPVV